MQVSTHLYIKCEKKIIMIVKAFPQSTATYRVRYWDMRDPDTQHPTQTSNLDTQPGLQLLWFLLIKTELYNISTISAHLYGKLDLGPIQCIWTHSQYWKNDNRPGSGIFTIRGRFHLPGHSQNIEIIIIDPDQVFIPSGSNPMHPDTLRTLK